MPDVAWSFAREIACKWVREPLRAASCIKQHVLETPVALQLPSRGVHKNKLHRYCGQLRGGLPNASVFGDKQDVVKPPVTKSDASSSNMTLLKILPSFTGH